MKKLSRKYLKIAELFREEAYLLGSDKEDFKYAYLEVENDFESLPKLREAAKTEAGLTEFEESRFAHFISTASEVIQVYGGIPDDTHLKQYARELEPAVRWLSAKLNGKLEEFENSDEVQPDLCAD